MIPTHIVTEASSAEVVDEVVRRSGCLNVVVAAVAAFDATSVAGAQIRFIRWETYDAVVLGWGTAPVGGAQI